MKLTWFGHSGFRLEIGGQVLLVDPWFTGNPVFPEDRRAEAISGATHILLTHGHGDHAADTPTLAAELEIPVICIHELSEIFTARGGIETMGMGKGGTISLGDVAVTMVNAVHSSSMDFEGGIRYAGDPAGFMIAGEGHVLYVSGDTDIMADMAWMGELHKPDIGILCCGGHYTMDMERAAFAARTYFDFKTIVPCHYKTFPILAQTAAPLADLLPGVEVRELEVMEPTEL
ncbi:metal-dependent hydrolase [Ponticoccus sp. SC2-23]|uniref:metal-dependent hydrolase n=1 Tax=Alexandriicola marinus TaxID=2081710 RepID=UPI000FDB6CA6|nr:metal-dependent hydrolase [Alexandriicola marinus]MBM1219721.1 metal-dependent hydrolase [Ponticoccus sp. SC6-9]MBM1223207.1 metal-dependent hydrolase [Ponticoccus sp. SC6-15]MBM1229534.1 metal-dependent hydrolase [Ponticoccus sp. SC6-38]MBM1232173.1 metal-dependent hydrolase [Ponticoccus sp. SC6-45]MBM1237877.1 metal-dependent hydrolase [Ponticoccus sp. SC6-49]MBM1241184.1 metal-dependent hydrolase [Ponticoccus sp. SC2-64]MBM1245697.1 metal-dependent hydrolase [Ponticoccus sp. SC6-42]MB